MIQRCLSCLLFIACGDAYASCTDDGRLRGEFDISLAAGEGVVLRIEQIQEEVAVTFTDPYESFRISHPGGAGLDHFVLLEAGDAGRHVSACVESVYQHSPSGTWRLKEIPLDTFSGSEIEILRKMTEAAQLWGAGTASRGQAMQLYADIVGGNALTREDARAQIIFYQAMGLARSGAFSQALQLWDRLATQATDPLLRYKIAWRSGETRLRLGQPANALPNLLSAIAIIDTELDGAAGIASDDWSELHILMAEAYLAQDDLQAAEQHLTLATPAAAGDFRLLANIHDMLGYFYIVSSEQPGLDPTQRRNFLSDAVNVILTGRYFAESAHDLITLAAIENNLGFVYEQLGELRRALTHFRQLLALVEPEEDPVAYRYAFSHLGKIYQYTADYPRSESYYRQAVLLGEISSGATSLTRCPLGTTLRLDGHADAALSEHKLCLQQAESMGDRSSVVLAQYELGEDYFSLRDYAASWNHIRWAWEQGADAIVPALRSRILRRYANLLQMRGHAGEANDVMAEALALHHNQFNPVDVVEDLAMSMHIAIMQGRDDDAEKQGHKALEVIEAQYETLESERLGPSWSDRVHEIYVELAQHYLDRYSRTGAEAALREAFNISERSRAATLRQQLAADTAGHSVLDETPTSIAEREQIERISRIASEHAMAGETIGNIRLPVNYYHHQDLLSLHRLQKTGPSALPQALDIEAIQRALKPGQTVLHYLVTDGESYVFTVTRDSLQVDSLGSGDELDKAIHAVKGQLANANGSPYEDLAALSTTLLPRVIEMDSIDELIIVPHGSIHKLPFAVLSQRDGNGYSPLIQDFTVLTVPSMSVYLMEKALNHSSDEIDIAVFADPVFGGEALSIDQLAAFTGNGYETLRGWTDSLERLEYTAVEARNLQQLFPRDSSIVLTGRSASRANLARTDVRSARVLHIATHGYFNAVSDDNVGLGFSTVDEHGVQDTGFVTLPELFSYRFNNELVVVSGCDTAMGRSLKGEGMMGLARGFIAQGASHVISTLWPVSDRASAEFMAIFYRQLLTTRHVSRALQSAQAEMQQNPLYRNPFYWGAYVLSSVSPDQNMTFTSPADTSVLP